MLEAKILVIDDAPDVREVCAQALLPHGLTVEAAACSEGLRKIESGGYDLVLLDLGSADLVASIHARDPEAVCIILTQRATAELAVKAVQQGAYDFVVKPFTAAELRVAAERGLERRRLSLQVKRLQAVEAEARRLAQDKARLEEIDKSKMAFIRLVTHELQAPVAAIQNYMQLILDG